jgi:hypothetical protein
MKARWTLVAALGGAAAVYAALGASDPVAPAPVVSEHRTVVVREAAPPAAMFAAGPGAIAGTPTDRGAAPATPEPEPPTAEQAAAADVAMSVVDAAIGAGRWTDDDNVRLATQMHQLHVEDRDSVMQVWATAVNEQRLKIEAPPAF